MGWWKQNQSQLSRDNSAQSGKDESVPEHRGNEEKAEAARMTQLDAESQYIIYEHTFPHCNESHRISTLDCVSVRLHALKWRSCLRPALFHCYSKIDAAVNEGMRVLQRYK